MKDHPSPLAGYAQLKKLRTALAVSQGIKLLATLQKEIDETVSHDQAKRVTYMTELFFRIHREMFRDWQDQASVEHRPGVIVDAGKRKAFREAIECLVLNDNNHTGSAIFDNNGFVIYTENIAERLAGFYRQMRAVRPFSYGNRLTLDLFMTALGSLPAFKSVYGQGIDFRRLSSTDTSVLHCTDSTSEELSLAFVHALDPSRKRPLANIANGYGIWPENKKFIFGIPFLSHWLDDGTECLVSVNGGLLPFAAIEQEVFLAGKHLADYPRCEKNNIVGYLPGTEALRAPEKQDIDGIRIGEDGAAPLFCLDINLLTGLRSPAHTELMELLHRCAGTDADIFDLVTHHALKDKMIFASDGDVRLARSVEIAYDRLGLILNKLEQAKAAIFIGKMPDPEPKFFMSMGGAGSGKTAVEEIAAAHCGDNFVITSLDEFRKISDLYQVLTAANHHSDDYVYVEPFANRLRSMVANHALEHGFNILYDGTGIPYKPRYTEIVERYRKAGFRTQITAVDAFLVKPEGREDELPRSAVVLSVKQRFEQTGRALPWVVTVDKHIRAPDSFLTALHHSALEKIALFANDGERDKHYLVAESFDLSDDDVHDLHNAQHTNALCAYLENLIKRHPQSILNKLASSDRENIERLLKRNPAFKESNTGYLLYAGQQGYRGLLIYNVRRMADFIEKRQLNPNASGEDGLLHKPENLAFHVDPEAKEAWMTRLQDAPLP